MIDRSDLVNLTTKLDKRFAIEWFCE